ncbi:MAG TPA: branched-chain amino acid ABC transporter permease [Ktedonobacterales bacterium]|nr:branched-chain amino acid ABC transporter permease [Ktedonobacterales bacterium]
MELLITLVLGGIVYSGLLFLVASGFTLIFGLLRVANLAHGALYLVGAYLGYDIIKYFGASNVNFLLAVLAGVLGMGIFGVLVERIMLRFVRGQELPEVLITVGLALIMADLSLVVFTSDPVTFHTPPFLSGRLTIGHVVYPWDHLFVFFLSIAVGVGLWLLTEKTRIGAIIRAGVDDAEMVSGLGINIKAVFTGVFFLGAALAGLAGVCGALILGIAPGDDSVILRLGLVVVILGGLGSLTGAVIGSLIVGLVFSLGTAYLPELQYFLLFAPMVIMLAVRPRGLFGRA